MEQSAVAVAGREPWNKGKLVGQKAPLKLKEIWAIRIRLQLSANARDLALFNLAIDSKLRACDLVKIRVRDVSHGDRVTSRAIDAAEDSTPCPVRAHRSNPRSDCGMGCSYASSARRFPVSQSSPWVSALVDASIRADCGLMGVRYRTRP